MNTFDQDKHQELAKSFKIALTNSSVYFFEHPTLSKSLSDFRERILGFIQEYGLLTIMVKPNVLVVGNRELGDKVTYKELADFLHCRKIKSIKIEKEVSIKELLDFLATLSLAPGDILAQGGVGKILKNKGVESIEVIELDYSYLLSGSGAHIKDIWSHIFNSRKEEESESKNNNFLNVFSQAAEKFDLKEVIEDQNLSGQLLDLFSGLEDKAGRNFRKLVKKLGESLLKADNLDKIKNKERFKKLFSYFAPEDLADLFFSIIESKKALNQNFFNIFSLFIPMEIHKNAAKILGERIKNQKSGPTLKKLKGMLFMPKAEGVVPVYQQYLLPAIVKSGKSFCFDAEHLGENYRLSLLDLFFYETNTQRLGLITKKISELIQGDFPKKLEYLNKFSEIYRQKPEAARSEPFCKHIEEIWTEAEESVFDREKSSEVSFLKDVLSESTLGLSYYLDKIKAAEFNVWVFRFFLKFFPRQIIHLQKILTNKKNKPAFFQKAVDDLVKVEHLAILDILEKLYNSCSVYTKIKILDKFKDSAECKQEFLIAAAKDSNIYLRKKAVEAAVKFPQLQGPVAEELFSFSFFSRFNSRIIAGNLDILADIYNPAAKPFLEKIAAYRFFWSRKTRKQFFRVLEVYSGREN